MRILFLVLTLLFSPSAFAVSETTTSQATLEVSKVQTYEQLAGAISKMREGLDRKNKQDKVREAWMLGQLIEHHVEENYLWSDYSGIANEKISKEFKIPMDHLWKSRRFYRTYAEMPPLNLSWEHYLTLLYIPDPAQRETLRSRAVEEKWTSARLQDERKKLSDQFVAAPESIVPGPLNLYRVIKPERGPYQNQLILDLGFDTYYQPKEIKKYKEGDILKLERLMPNAAAKDLGTYRGTIVLVADGDTFEAILDLGFKLSTQQKFRLNGLDAPELKTEKGPAAKAFFIQQIPKGGQVLLRATKRDKFNRFLADVFIPTQEGTYLYLNQLLLDQGYAVKFD